MPEEYWFLLSKKLTGDATYAELARLQQYMLEDPEFAERAKYAEDLWHKAEDGDPAVPHSTLEHIWQDIQADGDGMVVEMPQAAQRRPWVKWITAASIAVLLFAGYWFLGQGSSHTKPVEQAMVVSTQPGLRSIAKLPDGSEVRLNAGTTIKYKPGFGKTNRDVWLDGEAYFTVTKNKALPFIVHTRDYAVRVTGTIFNVRAYKTDNDSETALVEGGVDIILAKDETKVYRLKPQEKFQYKEKPGLKANPDTVKDKPVALEDMFSIQPLLPDERLNRIAETAWVDNMLVFQSETLDVIARKMSMWYGVKIIVSGNMLSGEKISGSFTTETLEEALEVLRYTTPFHYSMDNDSITIFP